MLPYGHSFHPFVYLGGFMGLNWKMTAYKEVNYWELAKFINEEFPVFNGKYELLYIEEWSNDSYHVFNITGKLSEHRQKAVDESLKTGKVDSYGTQDLLDHLCKEGRLEKGSYLIRVSW
jgi:hypothetical protein